VNPAADDVRVTAVVVTFRPDATAAGELLRALAPQVRDVVVVDNGSDASTVDALRAVLPDAQVIALGENTGVAAAQNAGIARARELGATHVLLSDQDSVPAPDMVAALLRGLHAAQQRGSRPAAVGPIAADTRSEDEVMVYAASRWGPRRSRQAPDADGLLPAAFLIASGCLVPVAVLDEVGTMRAEWFIDHVDLEWGLRARRAGRQLFAVADARLAHRLGDRLVRLPGRRQEVHVHTPVRVYYLTRNTVLLLRSGLLPLRWRLGYVLWLAKYVAFNALLAGSHRRRARLALRGLRDGLAGRTGALRA